MEPELVFHNCKVIHDLYQNTVDCLRGDKTSQVIDRKNLSILNHALEHGLLQAFRADCLASIISNPRVLAHIRMVYALMMTSRFELTVIHMLLRRRLPAYLKPTSHEAARDYFLKMHRKEMKKKWDEISRYEVWRRHRVHAEFN